MAHWGKAMALYHQLWDFPDKKTLEEGRKELDKAKKQKHISPREKGFIETAQVFFQKNDKLDKKARIAAYSDAMEKWYASLSSDVEVGSFYALSLVALAYEEDAGEALELRRKAIGVLNPLFEQHPDHPGVAHYIIHATDEQSLAPQGLAAARRYAAIAPDSSHAIHMPSHIFVRLGMWQDSITSNVAAQGSGRACGGSPSSRIALSNARDGFPELLVFAKRPARQGPSRHHGRAPRRRSDG